MVNATSDPEVLEEVWFVLAKGIGSSTNSTVRITMQYLARSLLFDLFLSP